LITGFDSRLFDYLITGDHNPLRFGWDDAQLEVVAHRLGLSGHNRRAVAAVICSLVAARLTDGKGELRYSRTKRVYAWYAYTDPLMSYRHVVPAMDFLIQQGWAKGKTGSWWSHKESIAWATPDLLHLVGTLVDISRREVPTLADEIILRDADKKSVAFTDTDEIRMMRNEVRFLNEHLSTVALCLDGHRLTVPLLVRIFNRTFDRGGRLYCQGASHQNMPKELRDRLTMMVDGRMTPTVELDFSTLHPKIAYWLSGKRMPDGDAYDLPGFARALVKPGWNVLVNADSRTAAVKAIAERLRTDAGLRKAGGISTSDWGALRRIADRLCTAIKRRHYRIKEFFGSDAGARFQRIDSDMAARIMQAMIKRTGRCPLSVHDSFIVPECDAQALAEEMELALSQAYSTLFPAAATTRPPSIPIHLGNHDCEQGQQHTENSLHATPRGWGSMSSTQNHDPPALRPPLPCSRGVARSLDYQHNPPPTGESGTFRDCGGRQPAGTGIHPQHRHLQPVSVHTWDREP
jgi:hypothetical protein